MKTASYNYLINKLFKNLFVLFLFPILIGCASTINKKTYIDAKLMPEETARDILEKNLNISDFDGFYMYPQMKFADSITYYFCDFKDPKYFPLKEIEVNQWYDSLTNNILLASKEKFDDIGYPCSDPLSSRYKKYLGVLLIKGDKKQQDVINALVSLGVSIDVEEDSD